MYPINYYVALLLAGSIYYKGTRRPVIVNSCSALGLALELAVKDFFGLPLDISKARGIDIVATIDGKRRFVEVKSNYSPLSEAVDRSSIMVYCFGVQPEKPLCEQWGYVLAKKDFMEIGKSLNHITIKKNSKGRPETVTQTVWNNKKQQPHGAKAYKLEDAYIAAGAVSFGEFFGRA